METKQTAMTPKEKAEELCMNFIMKAHTDDVYYGIDKHLAKQCALIAVDEVMNSQVMYSDYWEAVKKEIEKL